MDKIKLPKRAKEILKSVKKNSYIPDEKDREYINLLVVENLVDAADTMDGYAGVDLSEDGEAYMLANPELKDPSIWDDKKYWITTFISLLALIMSIIAIFK